MRPDATEGRLGKTLLTSWTGAENEYGWFGCHVWE